MEKLILSFFPVLDKRCEFVSGDGAGGKDVKIGTQTGSKCIDACLAMKVKDSSINGVTILSNNKDGCWCEKNMNKVAESKQYQTCFLKG